VRATGLGRYALGMDDATFLLAYARAMSDDSAPQAPAGWYPDSKAMGGQRYWDGQSWSAVPPAATQLTQSVATASVPVVHRTSAVVVRPVPAGQKAEKVLGAAQWSASAKEWRRWSGRNWLPAMYSRDPAALRSEQGPFASPPVDGDKRARFLEKAVAEEILRGGTPVLREPYAVVMSYKRPVSHVAHAVASVLTLGLWTTVWIVMAIARKEDRVRLEVDQWCNIWGSDLPR
jgi:hypothetical protein